MGNKTNVSKKSGVTGVTWRSDRNKWMAQIRVDGKLINLGNYIDVDQAIKARRDAETLYFGNHLCSVNISKHSIPVTCNITIDFNEKTNKWIVKTTCGENVYCLGQYTELDKATIMKIRAENYIKNGTFIKWYKHKFKDQYEKLLNNNFYVDIKVGDKFGKLTVIAFSHEKLSAKYWLCRCECGSEKVIKANSLKAGITKACGCAKGVTRYKIINDMHKNNTSGYQGVYFNRRVGRWLAEIYASNKKYPLGQYDDIEIAAHIRKTAERHKKDGTFEEWYYNDYKKKPIK